ncbi:MAG: putative D,D-dipeptide transport system permease protein DdpB, partial [Chloroflexi bacterium]|nr:putative D,D-dipeptide transport system permease protein DdpB [Chloroflexota bacterium]
MFISNILHRIPWLFAVLLFMSLIIFTLSHVVPANPAAYMAGQGATQDQINAISHSLGLDKPLPVQYGI